MSVLILLVVLGWPMWGHAAVLFDDDFEYVADRNVSNVQTVFEANGWSDVKAENGDAGAYGGYLYTQTDATRGGRVLVMEALPDSVAGDETDFYLKYGTEASPLGTVPADVWFQYWLYTTTDSLFGEQKLLYPCFQSYPCPGATYRWIFGIKNQYGENPPAPTGGHYMEMTSPFANNAGDPSNPTEMVQNLNTNYFTRGVWRLFKIHVNTSGAQGTYELWARAYGTAAWTKYSEWLGGVTSNFTWSIPEASRGGQRQISIPTTVGIENSTQLMDDFVMAESESDLPTYSDGTVGSGVSGSVRFTGSVRIQ